VLNFLYEAYQYFLFGLFLIVVALALFFPSRLKKLISRLVQKINVDDYVLKSTGDNSEEIKAPKSHPSAAKNTEANDIEKGLDEQDSRIAELPVDLTISMVKLTPSVGNAPTSSWFRGLARFPLNIEWPKHKNKDMLFIGQVSLQNLPKGLWFGHGPRSGWLLFFISLDSDGFVSKAIHTPELGPERLGPKSSDAAWHRIWKKDTQPWPDNVPAYLQAEVVKLIRQSESDSWPNHWPPRSDSSKYQISFLGGRRDIGAGYPLIDGYDVPLLQLPSDPKFGWNWHDTGPCFFCARGKDIDDMNFSDLCWAVEA
jgi:Domain of unknown function (DUF1963)